MRSRPHKRGIILVIAATSRIGKSMACSIPMRCYQIAFASFGKAFPACALADSTLAGIAASGRASAPARNNHRSVGDTDVRETSFGPEFARSYILSIFIKKIAKNIRTGFLQKVPDDLGFLTNLDQSDGE